MTTIKTMEIKLERTIPAPAAEVFDAWLDPNTPVNPFSGTKKLIFDLKENALFYFVHRHEGADIQHYGMFTAIERPKRVQYTWMSPYTHGLESIVTVTFRQQGGETLLSLSHANLPDDDYGRAHDGGWAGYLKKIAALFFGRQVEDGDRCRPPAFPRPAAGWRNFSVSPAFESRAAALRSFEVRLTAQGQGGHIRRNVP